MANPPLQTGKTLPRPGRRLATRQVLDMQEAMYRTALLLKGDAQACSDGEQRARVAVALASLAKGWDALENRKRILRGRPLPGSLRPEKPKDKIRNYYAEPIGPADYSEERVLAAEQPTQTQGDEGKWEMQDILGFPGAGIQVALDSPALRVQQASAQGSGEPNSNVLGVTPNTTGLESHTPSPAQEAHRSDRTMRVGDRIDYGVPPDGPRVIGTLTKVPQRRGDIAVVVTAQGDLMSFNPDLVPWEHAG